MCQELSVSRISVFILLSLFLLELLVIIHGSLLVLLVLGDEIVHVGLRFGKFHFVHALASVPVEEGLDNTNENFLVLFTFRLLLAYLATEHCSELLTDPLEQFLDGC